MAKGTKTPIEPGLIARVVAGVRYGLTGQKPEWFGPGDPLPPVAQQAAQGRQFDFPVMSNVRRTPRDGEAVTFEQMRALADSYDLLRLVIETRKDQLSALNWHIKPKDEKAESNDKCTKLEEFFHYPDKEHAWDEWLRMIMEDMLVLDAPCIYPRMTVGGALYALEPVDGATIKRILDKTGRTPIAPDPAYQQILKGMTAVDYSREELIYRPRNPRTHKVYGYSPVEQIIVTVNIALRRQLHQLQFYTEGNVPEALASVPSDWQPEQIKQFQEYWDSLLEGDTAARRHLKFIPDGVTYKPTKEGVLKDEFDEWLARVVCFCFSIEPTPFVKQVNRSTSETAREQSLAEGVTPSKRWIKSTMDYVLTHYMDAPELEFRWDDEKAVDPLVQAQIDEIYVRSGIYEINEIREERGMSARKDPKPSAGSGKSTVSEGTVNQEVNS